MPIQADWSVVMENKKSNFTGSLGFILAAAGSAVGVGNIWRFPYLAAQNGGGLFILVYLVLVFTFGFTLLTSDIALGRKTGKNPLYAYGENGWQIIGKITFLVPVIIITYYLVIGGWVTKYMVGYFAGQSAEMAKDGFFGSFITSPVAPIVYTMIYLALTAIIVFFGVEKGIEKFSKTIMPILFIIIIGIAIFSLTLTHTGDDGVTRTGIEGLKIYLIPDFSGITVSKFLKTVLDATGQLFYSLSISMGIMITYGSYVKKDVNLAKSITSIEIFDTLVAVLAGMMIIPAVYAFSGTEGLTANGPGLIFVALPKIFEAMGAIGPFIGALFFIMVAFAALTSSVSLMETIVASCIERYNKPRKTVAAGVTIFCIVGSLLICLGYSLLYFEIVLPNTPAGSNAQLLDVADYISNYLFMPLIAISTCLYIGWYKKPQYIIDEVELGGHKFSRKGLYTVMVRYIVPIMLVILFINSFIPAK